MEEPIVSVAMCTYNGAKFVARQMDSILAQTHTNMEVIVVDDKSTDDTFNIIRSYAGTDSRVKCYQNEKNIGFNKNFEKALSYCTGRYIAISDQDDIWMPQKIERLLSAIGNNWLVFSNSAFIDDDNQKLNGRLLAGFSFSGWTYKSLLIKNIVTGHTCLMSRELLAYILPFPAHGFYDWWIGFVAIYKGKATFLDEELTQYRIHDQSVIRTMASVSKAQMIKTEQQSMGKFLTHLITYGNLAPNDRAFIEHYQAAVCKSYLTGGLISLLLNNYSEFFAGTKRRKGLSRLNFAIKMAKRLAKPL